MNDFVKLLRLIELDILNYSVNNNIPVRIIVTQLKKYYKKN